MAIGHFDAKVLIVDPITLETIAHVPGTAARPDGLDILRRDDGTWRLLAVGDGRLLRFIDPGEQLPTETMLAHDGPVADVAVSPDGGMIATASTDRTARLWHPHVSDRRLRPSTERPAGADVARFPDRLGTWLTMFVDAARQCSGS